MKTVGKLLLLLMSELRTVMFWASSAWKTGTPTQPPQSTVQLSMVTFEALSAQTWLGADGADQGDVVRAAAVVPVGAVLEFAHGHLLAAGGAEGDAGGADRGPVRAELDVAVAAALDQDQVTRLGCPVGLVPGTRLRVRITHPQRPDGHNYHHSRQPTNSPNPDGGGGGGVDEHALVVAVTDDVAERLPAASAASIPSV